jgi:hypothetical protein
VEVDDGAFVSDLKDAVCVKLRLSAPPDCLRLLQVADPTRRAEDPRTQATVICPTNAALRAFAARMGLKGGVDELAARTDLVDKLAAYHVAPRVRASASAVVSATLGPSRASRPMPRPLGFFVAIAWNCR